MLLRKRQRCISAAQQRQRLVWERATNWTAFFHWHLSKVTHTHALTHTLSLVTGVPTGKGSRREEYNSKSVAAILSQTACMQLC